MSDHTQNEQPVQQEQQPQQNSSEAPLFQVGDRNYDVDSAKTKIANADQHISKLEQENAAMKEAMEQLKAQADSSSKLDQVLETLQAKSSGQASTAENTTQAVDKEALIQELLSQVGGKVEETLTAKQRQEQTNKALEEVSQLAQAKYGSDYSATLREKGKGLGYSSDEEILQFAAEKPEAFKQLFGLGQTKVQSTVTPNPSINTQTGGNNTVQSKEAMIAKVLGGFNATDSLQSLEQLRALYRK